MEKNYQEVALSAVLKTVVALGSVYLITEKFIVQINHLFNFDSMKGALIVFYFIYFILPIAIVAGYFFFKDDSVAVFKKYATNPAIALIAGVFGACLIAARWTTVYFFIYAGYALIIASLLFLIGCYRIRNTPPFLKQRVEILSLALVILAFASFYLVSNTNKAKNLEAKFFENDTIHFSHIDSVEMYRSSGANKFQPGASDKLRSRELREFYFKKTIDYEKIKLDSTLTPDKRLEKENVGLAAFNKKITDDSLIEWTRNRWGLFINILSFKALLVLLPFIAVMLLFIFLFSTTHTTSVPEKTEIDKEITDSASQKIEGDEKPIATPKSEANKITPPADSEEKRFLKVMLVVMVTITLPLMHPLEAIKSNKLFPSFSGVARIETIDSVKYTLHTHDTITVIDSVYIIALHDSTELEKIKQALTLVNRNMIEFSNSFGDESRSKTDSASRLLFFKPKRKLTDVLFAQKKNKK